MKKFLIYYNELGELVHISKEIKDIRNYEKLKPHWNLLGEVFLFAEGRDSLEAMENGRRMFEEYIAKVPKEEGVRKALENLEKLEV